MFLKLLFSSLQAEVWAEHLYCSVLFVSWTVKQKSWSWKGGLPSLTHVLHDCKLPFFGSASGAMAQLEGCNTCYSFMTFL